MSSRGVPGAAPLRGTAAPASSQRRAASAADVRAAYHHRLEVQVERALDAFRVSA